jgi:hypothetical protein
LASTSKSGTHIRLKIETSGEDHEGEEHTVAPGALGRIDMIEWMPEPQKLAITVNIGLEPDEMGERQITNAFDEADPEDSRFPFEPITKPFEYFAHVDSDPDPANHGWYIVSVEVGGKAWDSIGPYDSKDEAKRVRAKTQELPDVVAVRKMLVCSTSHVSPETRDWLDAESAKILPLHRNPRLSGRRSRSTAIHGWMFYAQEEYDENLPAEIIALMNKARELGADWVDLDWTATCSTASDLGVVNGRIDLRSSDGPAHVWLMPMMCFPPQRTGDSWLRLGYTWSSS